LEQLGRAPALVLDGGLGSLLIRAGMGRGQTPEGWVLERPDEVLAVHRGYVEAGSQAVHTATFGANPIRLRACGLDGQTEPVNRAAVALARQAGARFVLGDVGPTGEYLPPVGSGDLGTWRSAFEQQGRALAAAGVDAFHIETMSDLREAETALAALGEVAPEIPVLASLTFERKRRGFFTVMGNPVVAALKALAEAGAAAVGANCSIASADMRELAAELLGAFEQQGIDTPVVLQPNAGQPRVTPDGVVYDQSPDAFARDMAAVAGLGAGAVGGCCGTDPDFIAALGRRLQEVP